MTIWSFQDVSTDALQIENITFTPDPPQPGADLKGTLQAYVANEIADGAYAQVTVKQEAIKLYSGRIDLFAELKKEGSPWSLKAESGNGEPLAPGQVELMFDGRLPQEIARRNLFIDVRAYTANGEPLATLTIKAAFTD